MANKPNSKKQARETAAMTGAMKFFLSGLVAELYLMIIRRFYVNGSAVQMLAWFDYLYYFSIIGVVILVAGGVLASVKRGSKNLRETGCWIAAGGAFLALASFLIWKLNAPAVTLLSVAVAVAMLLGILWHLYDRECAYALTILGVSLVALWACRRAVGSVYTASLAKVAAIVYIALLVLVVFLVRKALSGDGKLGKYRLLPAKANGKTIYAACAVSAAAVATALISVSVAYYAMWALALVVFALAVYYTVKQL